ncbi:CocE/NonD family hydrolase [Pseudomaricurvus alkylphenolicus]|uniref:CocE/NonD family hydrolase n=1 Tax=Pseudomaricurvus alkylphenolicus TaxID=1306991 RepID=UPI001421D0C4|nr:CocE/NonD family hydrolase [Pseudomaricurvus alkylphenolicus]NIB38184.1 CocE/NonD family hydrolase [Pseudomaricurvus alkylphenolicus]
MSKSSLIGTYSGYSNIETNGYVRTSEYVSVRDGTRIAVDILHPARDGKALGGARPTVVRGTGYRRSFKKGESNFYDVGRLKILERYEVGSIITPYELAPNAKILVDHGYNFVSVDFRGTGASFGKNTGVEMGRDLADVIDWISKQPWSTDKVGMWGRSWEAFVQIETAAAAAESNTVPPACLMPMALTTSRNAQFYNGVRLSGFLKGWSLMRQGQDRSEPASPVDGPDGELLRDQARAEAAEYYPDDEVSEDGAPSLSEFLDEDIENLKKSFPHLIDSTCGELQSHWQKIDQVNAAGCPIYIVGGWWDMTFVNDQWSLYQALKVPKKILIGPWTHSQFEFGFEPLRWFDYWLKGIDNGIMDESPIHYSTDASDGYKEWHKASSWPLVDTEDMLLFAQPDGTLTPQCPEPSRRDHKVNHVLSNGLATRTPYMFHAMRLNYPHLDERAEQALSFTSEAMKEAVDITGVPSVELRLSCDQTDLAIIVTLEEIDSAGKAHYLTEGLLNLKHRKVSKPAWPNIETHWHSENKVDSLPVKPGEEMKVELDMFAISRRIEAGHRIRMTLSCSDRESYDMPAYDPSANVSLSLGGDDAFRISLPIISSSSAPTPLNDAFKDDRADYAFEM